MWKTKTIDAVWAWMDAKTTKDKRTAFNKAVREIEKELYAEIKEYKRNNRLSWKEQAIIDEEVIPNVHNEATTLVFEIAEELQYEGWEYEDYQKSIEDEIFNSAPN